MNDGLTTREVSDLLGVSIRTVHTYVKEGKLKARKDEQGRNRFDRKRVEAFRESLQEGVHPGKRNEGSLQFQIPENYILIERKQHEELLQRHEGLLVKLGQLEAENRLVRKQLEDMITRDVPEPIEADTAQAPSPKEPNEVPAAPEPESPPPQQHPAQAPQEGTQQQQDTWRKFVHGPAQIGPVDDPRPFWTAPVVEARKPWWKRLLGR